MAFLRGSHDGGRFVGAFPSVRVQSEVSLKMSRLLFSLLMRERTVEQPPLNSRTSAVSRAQRSFPTCQRKAL